MARIVSKIETSFSNLTPSDKLIAKAIKKNFDQIPFLTIHQLAKKINSSATTISRFVKKLGYGNFVDFKYDIIKEIPTGFKEIYEPISAGDSHNDIINKIFGTYINSLKETRKLLNYDDLINLAKLIAKAKRVLFFGIGASGSVSHFAASRFLHLDIQAEAYDDEYQMALQSLRVNKYDIVVGISHSGRSRNIINALLTAKELHATTVGISNYIIPQMKNNCDFHFCTSFKEHKVKAAAISSCSLQIVIIEILYFLSALNKKNLWNIIELNLKIERNLRV
jgi:DNA-binding MurR/RpiR family transcriptional regulator